LFFIAISPLAQSYRQPARKAVSIPVDEPVR